MKPIAIIFLLLVAARGGATGLMTLNDCLIYAREHARENRINRLEVTKAGADRSVALAAMLPYVGASARGSLSFGRNIDPETNTYGTSRTFSTGFGIDMSVPIFDGFVRLNSLKAASVARRRTASSAKAAEDVRSLEVIKAFYNVIYCRAMEGQIHEQLRRDSTDLAATRRCERLGTKSGADVAEMEAVVAADEYELVNRGNMLAKAYLELKGKMGMAPDSTALLLTEEENATAPRQRSGSLPEVETARLAVEESRYRLRGARGAWFPSISFSAGVSTSYYRLMGMGVKAAGFGRQWRDNMGQYIGMTLSIPLFDGLSTASRVKRSRLDLLQSRLRLEEAEYQADKAVAEAALDLRGAVAEHLSAVRRRDAELKAYTAVRRKYELGGASVVELYTSAAKLSAAEAALEGKRIAEIIADITLRYYQGEELIKEK